MINWTIVHNPNTDFETMLDSPYKFYAVICKKGRVAAGYLDTDWTSGIRFLTSTGAEGSIFGPDIIAYTPLDMTDKIISEVHRNTNGPARDKSGRLRSKFLEFYPKK